ncbi:MAG: hypothetical protein R3E57_00620 [Porticoccaceae bacterium]
MDGIAHFEECRLQKTSPVHGRVDVDIPLIQQVAVLNEQQRIHHWSGNLPEAAVASTGVSKAVQSLLLTVENGQANLGLLPVGRMEASIHIAQQFR